MQKKVAIFCASSHHIDDAYIQHAKELATLLVTNKYHILYGGGGKGLMGTVANEVFDVSGAGDTAISLLTISLLAGATLEEACWIGDCGSGVVVAKKGTATVDKDELIEFYDLISDKFKS